ncbi:group II intron maturase-specific domain-containing protein [Streptomyces sp. NPDC057565]|uniref:group II intron maturase-specific domain-containing protein n=1 Tax=Streptomyces sp. NPDC057565 TaxID=3346169 RepID=UPI0036AD4795
MVWSGCHTLICEEPNYFRHAVAKWTFSKLDAFTWWRLAHMLRARHGVESASGPGVTREPVITPVNV